MNLLDEIQNVIREINNEKTQDIEDLEQYRQDFKNKYINGAYKNILKKFSNVDLEIKKQIGPFINKLKSTIDDAYKKIIDNNKKINHCCKSFDNIDFSLPTYNNIGSLHPVIETRSKIINILIDLGFEIFNSPEIENDWNNFSSLNFPIDHPARDMQDTIFIDDNHLLRTHTTSSQMYILKFLKENKIDNLQTISYGNVYRNETISSRSHCFFQQIDGTNIGKNVSFADLKYLFTILYKRLFNDDVQLRFRPSYFPFTTPSTEVDISCIICHGRGCAICKKSGWLEVCGGGMIHPNVFKNAGIDNLQGYAFGMGVERLALLIYNINDIRSFTKNDHRFLKQFKNIDYEYNIYDDKTRNCQR